MFFFWSLKSSSIISLTNSLKDILGDQPNFCFALLGSPSKESTSVGLKYLESIFMIFFPLKVPTSFKPFPCQYILKPR